MKEVRIWFESYYLMDDTLTLLRENNKGYRFTIIATDTDAVELDSISYDEKFLINKVNSEDYIPFTLEFCKKNNINIFSPWYHQEMVLENKKLYDEIGVSLMLPSDAEHMIIAKNKYSTYQHLANHNIDVIPKYMIAKTVEEFKTALKTIKLESNRVCFKPLDSEGGDGYWEVCEAPQHDIKWLLEGGRLEKKIDMKTVLSILEKHPFPPLMVMEYLDGTEYTVDCIVQRGELKVVVIREKPSRTYLRRIIENEKILEKAKEITKAFQFHGVVNLQFLSRAGEEKPFLLEINPRFSGGVSLSSLSGVNFPLAAVEIALLGQLETIEKPKTDMIINQIKHGIIIEQKFNKWNFK
jgi:carbamoylphosphate synthase large subunit